MGKETYILALGLSRPEAQFLSGTSPGHGQRCCEMASARCGPQKDAGFRSGHVVASCLDSFVNSVSVGVRNVNTQAFKLFSAGLRVIDKKWPVSIPRDRGLCSVAGFQHVLGVHSLNFRSRFPAVRSQTALTFLDETGKAVLDWKSAILDVNMEA